MATELPTPEELDERLEAVVLSYLQAVDAGRAPDQQELLARHPDLAEPLRAFFDDQDQLEPLFAPLREPPPPDGGGSPAAGDTSDSDRSHADSHPEQAAGSTAAPPPGPFPSIPGYEILEVIGQGGMGIVYKARQRSLERVVALKMIRLYRLIDPSSRVRFLKEAQNVARLDHPNIVRVHECGEFCTEDGSPTPYLALEFVPGGNLAQNQQDRCWSPKSAAQLVAQLADAVEYAHQQGVVHRDLKPANILLTEAGVPKIADFGLSKQLEGDSVGLTHSGNPLGTPVYMAPEQAAGKPGAMGTGTDIFGLGAILYSLLTGRPPLEGDTIEEVLEQARKGGVRSPRQLNPRVPAALERICLKAMAADPLQRHPTAAALAADLRRNRRQRRFALLAAALAGSLLLLALSWWLMHRPPPTESPQPAPPTLAQRARRILESACYRCHGQEGMVEGGFNYVLDRQQLVKRKKVVPREPDSSRLFKRIQDGEMPPEEEKQRLSKADIATLEQWIKEGAAEFDQAAPEREFLTPAEMYRLIRADLEKTERMDREFLRYFTITHLYNAGLSEDGLESYRLGLSKLVNSLSGLPKIVRPTAIDPARTIFRIDLRDYGWNETVWGLILTPDPYAVIPPIPAAQECCEATRCRLPLVRADWFVFEASRPPLYHEILRLPRTAEELEKKLLPLSVAENIRQRKNVARAGFNGSGVARFNRLIERHQSSHGAYWKSYDFASAVETKDIRKDLFQHPLGPGPDKNSFRHDGGEIIFNLPNGLQAYMLVDAQGNRIDKGPTSIVTDFKQRDAAVVNGISCMSCHSKGMIDKEDQVRAHVLTNRRTFDPEEAAIILKLYPPREEFQRLLKKDAATFAEAVKQTGAQLGATDPIVALVSRYDWELDLNLAAAEVGLRGEELRERIARSATLARIFGVLRIEGGTVQRQVFADNFGVLVRELGLGERPGSGLAANSLEMKFAPIQVGKFVMGSPRTDGDRDENEDRQEVEISKPFYLGVYEVTQEEYQRVLGKNPSWFSAAGGGAALVRGDTARLPVEQVSWEDAQAFCRELSKLAEEKRQGRSYRLPTEAEWEYACRAGSTSRFAFSEDPAGLDQHAWYAGNSQGMTHPVGQKKPNAWGLYDMHGNVQEWCADPYDKKRLLPIRVLRGGSWEDEPRKCRSAQRDSSLEHFKNKRFGFRVVLEIQQPEK